MAMAMSPRLYRVSEPRLWVLTPAPAPCEAREAPVTPVTQSQRHGGQRQADRELETYKLQRNSNTKWLKTTKRIIKSFNSWQSQQGNQRIALNRWPGVKVTSDVGHEGDADSSWPLGQHGLCQSGRHGGTRGHTHNVPGTQWTHISLLSTYASGQTQLRGWEQGDSRGEHHPHQQAETGWSRFSISFSQSETTLL